MFWWSIGIIIRPKIIKNNAPLISKISPLRTVYGGMRALHGFIVALFHRHSYIGIWRVYMAKHLKVFTDVLNWMALFLFWLKYYQSLCIFELKHLKEPKVLHCLALFRFLSGIYQSGEAYLIAWALKPVSITSPEKGIGKRFDPSGDLTSSLRILTPLIAHKVGLFSRRNLKSASALLLIHNRKFLSWTPNPSNGGSIGSQADKFRLGSGILTDFVDQRDGDGENGWASGDKWGKTETNARFVSTHTKQPKSGTIASPSQSFSTFSQHILKALVMSVSNRLPFHATPNKPGAQNDDCLRDICSQSRFWAELDFWTYQIPYNIIRWYQM